MHKIFSFLNKYIPFFLLRFAEDFACLLISKIVNTYNITYRGYSVTMPITDKSAAQIYFRYLLTRSWRHEMYEQILVEKLLCDPMKGAWFIDGGSSYGMFSLLAASLPSVEKCIAIEASPKTFSYLKENISRNKLDERIKCINAAIACISGELHYVDEEEHSEWSKTTSSPLTYGHKLVEVISISLDDLIKVENIPDSAPIFIKLDIEGNEPNAFQGLQQLFHSQRNYMILFEFHASLLNGMEDGAKGFVNKIWNPELYVIYQIKSHLGRLDKINSLSDFENISDRCSASDFPNNLTNLLLSNRQFVL